jgi:preprotein translocase subunit SecA
MLKQLVTKVIGSRFERGLKHIQPVVDAIHEHEERLGALSDEQVQAQTEKLRAVLEERLSELCRPTGARRAEQ